MTITTVWLSDCQQYYAVQAPGPQPAYDVLAIQGPGVWLHPRYEPTGFQDEDLRYRYGEFPALILAWHNAGRRLRSGRWRPAFALDFADVRQDVPIVPYTGNILLARYSAQCRRQVRISQACWATLQARIAQAITAGHASLAAAVGERRV